MIVERRRGKGKEREKRERKGESKKVWEEREERIGEGKNKIKSIMQMSVCAKKRVRVISEGQLWILRSADMRRMLSSLYTFIFR